MSYARLCPLLIALCAMQSSIAEAKPRPYRPSLAPAATEQASDDVRKANRAARIEPKADSFANAMQVYNYTPGALFRVYSSVGKVTDIALQPGEQLVGSGPIAAGDTVRWIIGSTESGSGASRQMHVLIKPTNNTLATNLVINTDRRTYHIELQATASTYLASVSWRYPEDELRAIEQRSGQSRLQVPVAAGITPDNLDFQYSLGGAKTSWRPVRVFDDGRQVFIEFPTTISTTDMPPLFLRSADGKAELVNYRVNNRFMLVDRLFQAAELRLGDGSKQKAVRIRYTGAPRS